MNQRTHKASAGRALRLLAAALLLGAASASRAAAQSASTDPDNPTPMTSGVVTGKSNGKAKTVYYSFVATGAEPGEVKVKVTASTDERSTNLRVNFLDEDGQKLLDELYVIPNRDPATKVARHTFADRQKVVMRVSLPDDPQVELLTYKIDVSGAVEFEQPPAAADPAVNTGATPPTGGDPTAATAGADVSGQTQGMQPAAEQPPDPSAGQTGAQASGEAGGQTKKSTKQKVKEGAKKAGKSVLIDVLKDN